MERQHSSHVDPVEPTVHHATFEPVSDTEKAKEEALHKLRKEYHAKQLAEQKQQEETARKPAPQPQAEEATKCDVCGQGGCAFHVYFMQAVQHLHALRGFHATSRKDNWPINRMCLTSKFMARTVLHNVEMIALMEEAHIVDRENEEMQKEKEAASKADNAASTEGDVPSDE